MGEKSMSHKQIIKFNERVVESYVLKKIEDFDITKGNFLSRIRKTDKELNAILTRKLIENLKKILELIPFPLTIIYEPYYVDRVYRDEYYAFYSKKHFDISRNTKRLIFFSGCYYKKDFLDNNREIHEKIEKDLIGMLVIKPTQTIGRMLINPFYLNLPYCYIRTTKFELLVLGKAYELEAFPFSGQDSEVMTCAEVNMWQILEYFGCRYNNYKTLLPSEMLELITEISDVRLLPSDGLTVEQESRIFKKNGLAPKIYYKRAESDNGTYFETYEQYSWEPTFEEILHFYVESGIPILLNLREKDNVEGENHSVTCIGHSINNRNVEMKPVDFSDENFIDNGKVSSYNKINILKSWSNIDGYVIMEDHSAPYQIRSWDDLRFDESEDGIVYEIESFVVPLYKHVFMAAEDAYEMSVKWIINSMETIIECLEERREGVSHEIVIRLFLTTSRSYKQFRISNADSIQERVFFSQAMYPKFVWVCEYGTVDTFNNHRAIGEFVLDATSSKHNVPVISIRHAGAITYRGPLDPVDYVLYRRDIPIGNEFNIFEQNNLKATKMKGDCNNG